MVCVCVKIEGIGRREEKREKKNRGTEVEKQQKAEETCERTYVKLNIKLIKQMTSQQVNLKTGGPLANQVGPHEWKLLFKMTQDNYS